MALRRKRGQHGQEGGHSKGLAERIASATKPEPSGGAEAESAAVLKPGLTRYQRRSANLPSGARQMTIAELTNIVIDLRDEKTPETEAD